MSKQVFDYSDYKAFLTELGDSRPRGFRKALAEATHCQTAYISQVLNGDYHLSLEQGEAATQFLDLSRDEARCFVLLVEIQRAGTPSLKRFFEEQLRELRERYYLIKERIGVSNVLSEDNQGVYYSSWHYAAVHMAVTIPRLRTRTALGRSLRISPRKLGEILDFLCGVGLLVKEGEKYAPGSTQLHLPKDSSSIHRHHANWRQQAMTQMHSDHAEEDLHYSSVSSLSAADAQKIKTLLTQSLSDAVQIIKDSPEEQLVGINIDLFRVDE
ncbi:TIGR02147 family protein [Bdellovibrionota bacterium FG-1]